MRLRTGSQLPLLGPLVLGMILAGAKPALGDAARDAFFDRLEQHVNTLKTLDDQAKTIIRQALADRDADLDDESLLAETLVLISADFRAALDAYDEEDYAACVQALEPLADAEDPYLRYNARAYAAQALVHADRLVEAQARIAKLIEDDDNVARYTFARAELHYMLGYCQVQNLQHEKARTTLQRFLRDFPDASPRLVVTAQQMLAELARRVPQGIGEVADLMTFSEKRLAAGDVETRTRDAQQRAVDLLDQLIKKVEKMEQQQQQRSASGGQSRPQPQSQKSAQNTPAQDAKTPRGGQAESVKRPGRQVAPGEAWGAMPQAQREKILQVLRDRFPGRYRALVEQYYETLAEQP